MKKILSAVLALVLFVSCFGTGVSAQAASVGPSWSVDPVSVTFTDATIGADLRLPSKATVTKAGFFIGTSKDNMTRNGCPKLYYTKTKTISVSFNLNKCLVIPKYDTTYYYKFYVVAGGKTYTSPVYSFKTYSVDDYVNVSVSGITKNNAVITAKIPNPAALKVVTCSLQMGTSPNRLSTVKFYSVGSSAKNQNFTFDMNKIGKTLKADTTYYYRLQVCVGGVLKYTTVKTFETEPEATKIVFPLDTSKVWYCSTYTGHGGSNASARSSIDITLKNKKNCRGYAVYAVADGVVVNDKYKSSNGQITIKHTVKLVTTNGEEYTTWYSTYAHMTNITVSKGDKVKAGQQIGKVGTVGKKSTGYHLHFSMSSGMGGNSWYQEKNTDKAISPYYVYGFVDAAGNGVGYLSRDMKGKAVTTWLINHKPKGI